MKFVPVSCILARQTPGELTGALGLIAGQAFAKADENGDKRVDFREFALWWRSLP
jgi:hypothetical protein